MLLDNNNNNDTNNNNTTTNNNIAGVMELCEQLLPSRVYAAYNTSTSDEINTMRRMCGKVPGSLAHVLAGCSSQTKYMDTQA